MHKMGYFHQLQQRWEGGEAGGAKAPRNPGQRGGHAARGNGGRHGQLPKLNPDLPLETIIVQ